LTLSAETGIETVKQIVNNYSNSKILVLSSAYEEEKIILAMIAGAIGFIQDDVSQKEILDAIRMAFHNRAWISIDLTRALTKYISPLLFGKITLNELSKKELKIAKFVAKGLSDLEISEVTHQCIGTVRYHVRNIFNKLHLKNRTQLALYVIREEPTK